MGRRIAIVGAGAVGGYAGAHMVQAGEDVTFIDPWPAHVEHMRKHGLRVTHAKDVRGIHRAGARAACDRRAAARQGDAGRHRLRLHEVLRHRLGDHADPAISGARRLRGLAAELHERGDHRRHRRLGQDARLRRQLSITVNLPEPGLIHRGAGKGGAAHTVFRAGEVHGRITERAQEICRLVGYSDSAKVTNNLWGERWSKLVTNAMANGIAACTGLTGGEMLASEPIRRFSTRVGSEAIRVGQALGYQLEDIYHLPPETIARAGEGDEAAMHACDEERFSQGKRTAAEQRPSMGQDMQKGRRTEIEFLNGLIVREGEKLGLSLPRQCRADRPGQTRRTGRA